VSREGNSFVIEVIKHYGTARHAFISAKNPGARDYDRHAPLEAIEKFDAHMAKVRGISRLAGYVDYFKGSDSEGSDDDANRKRQSDKNKKRKRGDKAADHTSAAAEGRDKKGGAGGAGPDAKTVIKVDMKQGLVHGVLRGRKVGPDSVEKMFERAVAGKDACLRGLISQCWGKDAGEAACTRHDDKPRLHEWKEGPRLKACLDESAERPGTGAGGKPGKRKAANASGSDTGKRYTADKPKPGDERDKARDEEAAADSASEEPSDAAGGAAANSGSGEQGKAKEGGKPAKRFARR
jgi:hypothetical protein